MLTLSSCTSHHTLLFRSGSRRAVATHSTNSHARACPLSDERVHLRVVDGCVLAVGCDDGLSYVVVYLPGSENTWPSGHLLALQ